MAADPYDHDKAQHLFVHCLAANAKLSGRNLSRQELVSKLKQLSQFSVDRTFRAHLSELENHIEDLVKKERRIMSAARKERANERDLQTKINELEEKLSKFVEQKAVHEVKIKELEAKVLSRMKRKQMIHELQNQIAAVQEIYDEVAATRYLYDPSKIRKIETRLEQLKKKLLALEGKKE